MDNISSANISDIFAPRQSVVRQGCALYRIVQIDVPIEYSEISLYDKSGNDITMSSHFAWSTDNVCYTEWTDYNTFRRLTSSIETDFYVRILISTSLSRVELNGVGISCYSVCLDNTNIFLTQFCDTQLFSPYDNLDCALLLQQQLSDSIICMLGIPCYYFKVDYDEDSVDYTFKEYVMHNVTSCKYMKLMIQDGQLPSSRPQMTEFDFDWENDWEVEMSKTMFARAFGDTAFPKQRDLVYVPMLHRMYEVNSAYDEKNEGLLYRSTTWKLAMVKYNDKDNVSENEYESVIDNLLINQYDDMWRDVEFTEQERESGITQTDMPDFAANSLYNLVNSDAVRAQVTSDVKVVERQINNGATVVCRNMYAGGESSFIRYQNTYCGDDFTFITIVTLPSAYDIINLPKESKIVLFGSVSLDISADYSIKRETVRGRRIEYADGEYKISFNGMEYSTPINEVKSLMIICRAKRSNFTSDMKVIEHIHRKPGVSLSQPQMFRFDFDNSTSKVNSYNNDFTTRNQNIVSIYTGLVGVGSFKLYNSYLNNEESITEGLKYTTTDERCIINDAVRDFTSGEGFYVR